MQHVILAVVALLIVGLTLLVFRWPQGLDKTFSQHAAAQRFTIWYYFALFLVALPLLMTFVLSWFMPTLRLPGWFGLFVGLAAALQLMVAAIPETGGWKTTWHRSLTYVSSFFLAPAIILLIASPGINNVARLVAALCLAIMLGVAVDNVLGRGHDHILIGQAAYYGAFFAALLAAAYFNL